MRKDGYLPSQDFKDGQQDVYQRLACVEHPLRDDVCIFCDAEVMGDEVHSANCLWRIARERCGYVVPSKS